MREISDDYREEARSEESMNLKCRIR
jgi:hypothetical protein